MSQIHRRRRRRANRPSWSVRTWRDAFIDYFNMNSCNCNLISLPLLLVNLWPHTRPFWVTCARRVDSSRSCFFVFIHRALKFLLFCKWVSSRLYLLPLHSVSQPGCLSVSARVKEHHTGVVTRMRTSFFSPEGSFNEYEWKPKGQKQQQWQQKNHKAWTQPRLTSNI